MKKTTATLTATLGLVLGSLHAQTVPPFINYQGKVTDGSGVGLGTGTPVNRKVIFRIFDAPSAGNRLWSEQHTVTISNGEFSVLLGNGIDAVYNGTTETPLKSTTPLDTVFTSAGIARYVEILVDNGDNTINTSDAAIAPRQQITSTAYSFRARAADTITSGTDLQINGSANYGLGYYGSTRLFNGTPVDGPVLFGQSGGALGSVNGSTKNIALRWNAAGAVGIGSADLSGAAATTKLVLQGDDANTVPLQLNIRGNSDTNKRLLIGYNTTGNYGSLQSYSAASTAANLLLNPSGGNVAIGTTDNGNKLAVGGNLSVIGDINAGRIAANGNSGFSFNSGDGDGGLFSPADGTLVLKTDGTEKMRINSAGFVGIGASAPNAKLEVSGGVIASGVQGFRFNDGGDSDGGIFSPADGVVSINANAAERLRVTYEGKVGIGTTAPAATLDVRSDNPEAIVGTAAGTLGALYLGNASHGVKRNNSNNVTLYTTSGDVYLSTAGAADQGGLVLKTSGNVGIGTSAPEAALHVNRAPGVSLTRLGYLANSGFNDSDGTSVWGVGIKSAGSIAADYFVVLSDLRLKNVVGVSNGARDLESLAGIEITDYTMKDPMADHPGQVYKKVIAQQVEKVYPQAVTKGVGSIPDILKPAESKDGWIALATDLKPGEKVRLLNSRQDAPHEVLEVDAKGGRFRTGFISNDEKVFVYGRQVNDLRTVDYDALSMLNISATQQIKKEKDAEMTALQNENTELRARVAALEAKDATRDAKLSAIEKVLSADKSINRTVSLETAERGE